MEGLNPTAENMAKWLCDRIPHCIRVAVQETEGNTAVYENKFPVAEIFDSIDGEGKRTGYMAVFVRFAGCNIRCTYCDTAYA